MLEELVPILDFSWPIFKSWWWVVLPFVLLRPFLHFWLWWKRSAWYKALGWTFLEIKVPAEIAKTPEAMETILSSFHAIYGGPDTRETWIDGEINPWLSLELVAIRGVPHFYIRCPTKYRNLIESSIYSQYPDAEIFEAEDYTQNVPAEIPDADWNFFGRDWILKEDAPYPIRTYRQFQVQEAKEEKVVDPVAKLLEGMAKLGENEQLWIQILIRPITGDEFDLKKEGKKLVDKLVKRPAEKEKKPIPLEAAELLVKGPPKKIEEVKEPIPPMMKLTPGERDIVKAVEEKISKNYFQTAIRVLYLGKGEAYFAPNVTIPAGFFRSFSTLNLNWLGTVTKTAPKIQWILREPRVYLRKKRMFKLYKLRLPPLPATSDFWSIKEGTSILNTEELASLFHFPSRLVAPVPTMERIEAKKGEPPPGLPIE